MAKTYFWLKIQEDFYRQKEIKILRQMERGATYIIIYQKMLIHSLKNGNKLFYDNLKDSFEEELALIIDEEVEDVKATLDFLKRANLIDSITEEEYVLAQVEELTGGESEGAKRVRKHRENKKAELNNEQITDETFCNKNVTLDIDIDKELEKEKELEKDLDKDLGQNSNAKNRKKSKKHNKKSSKSKCVSRSVDENLGKISKLYEDNIGPIYPANTQYFIEISEKIHWTLFNRAIEICIDKSNTTPGYLKGIIRKWDEQKIYTLEALKAKDVEMLNKNSSKNKLKFNTCEEEKIDENLIREMKELEKKLGVS